MPIYEYHCSKCGDFETMQKMSDKPLTQCPTCRRKVTKLISSTSFQLKGSGWYITDYARKGEGGGAGGGKTEKKSDDKKSESKSESSGSAESSGSSDSSSSTNDSSSGETSTTKSDKSSSKTSTKAAAA